MMLLKTKELTDDLRNQSGTELIADLGIVDKGRLGYSECTVATGIERWQGLYFVWITVVHQKNRAGRHTRIVKWPYSKTSATYLERVIADLRVLENAVGDAPLPDNRGWFARLLDTLTRSEHLGDYCFVSPLQDEALYGGHVKAIVARRGGQAEVSLFEYRRSGVSILAQFPHAACARIRQALTSYAAMRQ